MSARDYVGHLSTISAYLELPTSQQEQVYSQIMQVLPETVEIAADITVHLARRRVAGRLLPQILGLRQPVSSSLEPRRLTRSRCPRAAPLTVSGLLTGWLRHIPAMDSVQR
jgi:hypothetical protein